MCVVPAGAAAAAAAAAARPRDAVSGRAATTSREFKVSWRSQREKAKSSRH